MRFGHNNNVTVGHALYHVQTENRGAPHAIIDTTVYYGGRVLHRRTSNYSDLLPLDPGRESELEKRVSMQHHAVMDALRAGSLNLPQHLVQEAKSAPGGDGKTPVPLDGSAHIAHNETLSVELMNAKTWLSGKRATLQVLVRNKQNGGVVAAAAVTARMDGAADRAQFSAETGAHGQAQIEFDMPRLTGPDCALVIEAKHNQARGHLRFQLRAKPRVPAAG